MRIVLGKSFYWRDGLVYTIDFFRSQCIPIYQYGNCNCNCNSELLSNCKSIHSLMYVI